jgi:hypothetical protein
VLATGAQITIVYGASVRCRLDFVNAGTWHGMPQHQPHQRPARPTLERGRRGVFRPLLLRNYQYSESKRTTRATACFRGPDIRSRHSALGKATLVAHTPAGAAVLAGPSATATAFRFACFLPACIQLTSTFLLAASSHRSLTQTHPEHRGGWPQARLEKLWLALCKCNLLIWQSFPAAI